MDDPMGRTPMDQSAGVPGGADRSEAPGRGAVAGSPDDDGPVTDGAGPAIARGRTGGAAARAARSRPRPGEAAGGSGGPTGLHAPHRRREPRTTVHEKPVAFGYRALSWLVSHVPARLSWTVGAWLAMVVYVAMPRKRHWVRSNLGHVLGVPPSDGRAGRLARTAYRTYARYMVELLRLPGMDRAAAAALVRADDVEEVKAMLAASRGLIFVVAHLGNNEALAAGLASHGLPVSVVADDSAYGELFELLRQQRAAWGVRLIPWRNLREVYGVLRRREMLGLLVDWGYRPDGIPVRFFDAWTTFPAGPAVLAARNGATILPVMVHRQADGRFVARPAAPITVASDEPEELARATQAIADELAAAIAAAPEQWYIFKPIWPESPEEMRRLEEQGSRRAGGAGGRLAESAEATAG